jgi:hypothetical protein
VPVKNDVPQILFATTPTLLVHVDGEPVWRAVPGTQIERAINSRALMLRERAANCGCRRRVTGIGRNRPVAVGSVANPPAACWAPPASAAAKDQTKPDPMMPADGKKPARAPAVLLATGPAELVITDGRAADEAGRRRRAADDGQRRSRRAARPVDQPDLRADLGPLVPRADAERAVGVRARRQLPADFAKISPQDPKANVLVSVPGTPQAREAEIAATIPQTASVSRTKATMTAPTTARRKFEPITGTSLRYAVNTGTPVIEVDSGRYYAVSNGVWFTSSAPDGPWQVATEVPSAIYTIPPSSPLYYVTYVRIYSVTPTTVVVGYTPGYMGVVVSPDGTVVYGTGYVYPPYVGTYYYGYPVTYGYGAGFGIGVAEGFAFGFAAGAIWGAAAPYWGPYWYGGASFVNVNQANFYGRWGQGTVTHAEGWNAWTGTQWRGTAGAGYNAATGARYQGSQGAAFNPYSGNYAAGARGRSPIRPPGAKAPRVAAWSATSTTATMRRAVRRPATTRRPDASALRKRASRAIRRPGSTPPAAAVSSPIRTRTTPWPGTTATSTPATTATSTSTPTTAGSSTPATAGNRCSRTAMCRASSSSSARRAKPASSASTQRRSNGRAGSRKAPAGDLAVAATSTDSVGKALAPSPASRGQRAAPAVSGAPTIPSCARRWP